MAGLRKTGLYTWEVKRLGTLPQPPSLIGYTPTGPASIPVTAPGSTSTPTGWPAVISQIIASLGRAASFLDTHPAPMDWYTAGMQSDPDSSAAHLRFAAAFLGSLRTDANGNYNPDQVRQILESLGEFERSMLSLQLSGRDPASDPLSPPLTFSVDTILADIAAGRVPGQKTSFAAMAFHNLPSVAARVPTSVTSTGASMPSVPGASGGSTTSTTALQNGATGAGAAAAQTQGVVSQAGQDYTPIVNATGPSASVPGYGVNPALAPLPSSSPSLADATWWKPALAIAIGAAVGVGIGRFVASR